MSTYLKSDRTQVSQKVAAFTGEGAYHGSSKPREKAAPLPVVAEMMPTTLERYLPGKEKAIFDKFAAKFPNLCQIKKELGVPTQEEIKADTVTFVWCQIEEAKHEAGPLTKKVIQEMEPFLGRTKKYVYIDSKIQFFRTGDLPVDSKLWHVDGTIAVRDQRTQDLGYSLLHDMKARMLGPTPPPKYLAYQSSHHCATQFVAEPVSLVIPDFLTSFDLLDQLVRDVNPSCIAQPAGSIVSFDGLSLHRAVPAQADGWRLWVRCVETDREVKVDSSIIGCYGTVFRVT